MSRKLKVTVVPLGKYPSLVREPRLRRTERDKAGVLFHPACAGSAFGHEQFAEPAAPRFPRALLPSAEWRCRQIGKRDQLAMQVRKRRSGRRADVLKRRTPTPRSLRAIVSDAAMNGTPIQQPQRRDEFFRSRQMSGGANQHLVPTGIIVRREDVRRPPLRRASGCEGSNCRRDWRRYRRIAIRNKADLPRLSRNCI